VSNPCHVGFDDKGKLLLPPKPELHDIVGHCHWLTAVWMLNRKHPILGATHEGLRGALGHLEFRRLDAPSIRFEPASRLNAPAKMIEDLSWQLLPSDDAVPAYKGEHVREIAHVARMLCQRGIEVNDKDETAGYVDAFLQSAQPIEKLTTYGNSRNHYEAAIALQREVDHISGLPVGAARYLIDANTGEHVIRVSDLAHAVRRQIGGGLARGWLDARMQGLGWTRLRLDGHGLPSRDGARQGPHARTDVYRGLIPQAEDAGAVHSSTRILSIRARDDASRPLTRNGVEHGGCVDEEAAA